MTEELTWATCQPWETLTASEKAASLIEELEATAERITRHSNSPLDGLLHAAADVLRELTAAPAQPEPKGTTLDEKSPVKSPAEGAQEDEPVAWPKLKKPATVGGGTFGVGVSARLVVESAQRHYEWAQEERDNPKTPEQRQDAEMSRRRLWDMLNGAPDAGAAAPVEGSVSAWTNTDEALPPEGVTVLGYADDVYLVELEILNGPDGSFESWTHYGQTFVRPTRWAFLPAAPKEKP